MFFFVQGIHNSATTLVSTLATGTTDVTVSRAAITIDVTYPPHEGNWRSKMFGYLTLILKLRGIQAAANSIE